MAASQRLAEIFGRRRFAIRPGTERISGLLARLDHPERAFSSIHVVGTNGKGSTASFLAAMLTAAGCRTGLFTSPHLISYHERFQIDGALIAQDALERMLDRVLAVAAPEDTFFELTTALACCWFAENGVTVAVLEAGMGGRSDATAAVPALCTLITPVSRDHSQWLGETTAAIAAEKAAIAEAGTPLLSARQEPAVLAVLAEQCALRGQELLLCGRNFDVARRGDGSLCYRDADIRLEGLVPGLVGNYQSGNAALAIAGARSVARQLGLPLTGEQIRRGIAAARWPGRMELIRLDGGGRLLLDGAHNPAGAVALAEALREYQATRITLLLGLMEDKDIDGILGALGPLAQIIVTVEPRQERALSAQRLAEFCEQRGIPVLVGGTVPEGVAAARARTGVGDLLVAAGSLFVVGEVKAALAGQVCEAVRG
ncbi:bifunctional folylpolyglutamate synthase/dihydrofolate synthase [Trichlorobacter ammonificans]|uniref:Dihydrofolate synthase/folylpolyglutamate synthase n=1 Tax=Trichlorobacter ammonificans TaxID=2916410 RepID=A0ABM9D5G5_9BACT|nr:folylpolyglutamate synthase/dihydrofolate synthase family protein [Trichlorobacter ammonificans]CAH2030415.1 Dihydrofolate synthase [Trichlorobacter ammonificans]